MVPALLAGAVAVDVYGKLKSGSEARRGADNRATALNAQAVRRRAQGKQQSDILLAQGGANQTSEASAMIGKGVSERSSIMGQSLDEIANRAKFASDQALEQAQADAESLIADAEVVSQEGRYMQEAAAYGSASSILKGGASFYGS